MSLWLCMSCSVAEGCSDTAGSSVPSRSAVRVTSAARWDDVVGCTHDVSTHASSTVSGSMICTSMRMPFFSPA